MSIIKAHYSIEELENMTDEALIEIYRTSDRKAIEVLVQRYKPLVRHSVKTSYYIGVDKEDLIQEGMIGLFKSINDYNEDREASFKTFATLCITRQITTALRTVTRQKHMPLNTSISLNVPVMKHSEDEEEITLIDILKSKADFSPEEEVISQENLEVLNKYILKVLSDMEFRVLKLYINGRNYQEIARIMEKSPKARDNALQRIKKKLESIRKTLEVEV